ncbi:hypothetical protein ACTXLQ_03795 [Enterococcus hirae]
MVNTSDKHVMDFIFQMNSCLTFEELNEWEAKLSDCSDEMIESAFFDKSIDIIQLSDEYLSKHYSKTISLLLRMSKLQNELINNKHNSNKKISHLSRKWTFSNLCSTIFIFLSNKYKI